MRGRKATSAALAIAAFLIIGFAARSQAADNSLALSDDVERILALPEDKIDVGLAALTIAKETYPSLDIQVYSQRIDALAEEVKSLTKGSTEPAVILSAMNTVLHQREGFHYDFSPDAHAIRENYFLNGLLDTKLGMCQNMSTLYIAVAQRAGFHMHAVEAPQHTFVRLEVPGLHEQNIDPTSGAQLSDNDYIERFHITEAGIKSGAYLRTMSNRELLGTFLMVAAESMRPTTSPAIRAKSIAYFEKAVELNPHDPHAAENLRDAYEYERMLASIHRDMKLASAYQEKADTYYKKTEELGLQVIGDSQ